MQAVGPAAAHHGAPGELVYDDNLATLDDVVDILELELLRLERVDDVQRPLRARVVQVRHLQQLLASLVALLGEQDGLLFLVNLVVVVLLQRLGDLGGLDVPLRGLVRHAGDDQRSSGLVDEDGVHLVDDAKVEVAEHELGGGLREVISKVIEAELGVGDVGDVAVVVLPALGLGHAGLDEAALEAEELVDLTNPLAVAPGEVVVDGDDVDTLAAEGVEEGG